MQNLVLIGGGGHCKVILDTLLDLREFRVVGIVDKAKPVGDCVGGIPVIGGEEVLLEIYEQGVQAAFIAFGSTRVTRERRACYERLSRLGFSFPCIIDRTALISRSAIIGEGTYVGKGAILGNSVRVGINSIINTGVIVEHDCNIGSHVHIAPGSTLSGGVSVGDGTHIGTNSTVIENIAIGEGSLIGAGSVVVSHIGNSVKAFGNPCKEVGVL